MLISPEPDTLTPSSSPFLRESRNSANPFENVGSVQCGADVLVVEDDINLSRWLCDELHANGFNTVAAFSAAEGFAALESRQFSIILLDRGMPGCDGSELLNTLRESDDRTTVFVMSGFGSVEDRIFGFENGADDYLVKPFTFPELLARLRARLRRAWSGENMQWRLGDLALHIGTRRVYRGGQEIALTPREFELLLYLVHHRSKLVTREMLRRDVWRIARQSASLDNSIDVHIAHLRRKIDADRDVKLIHTVRGRGFLAVEAAANEASA